MQRVTISVDDQLAEAFDALWEGRGYSSRSEAARDILRDAVGAARLDHFDGYCVANLSYVYDHHVRHMAERLNALQHDHHDLVMASAHVHLDHQNCLETVMLKGPAAKVRALADVISGQRGVKHAQLNLIKVAASDDHPSGASHHHDDHPHMTPELG
ncbi:nickel-responsive transcriptional regulator NikR [soil metagenome]